MLNDAQLYLELTSIHDIAAWQKEELQYLRATQDIKEMEDEQAKMEYVETLKKLGTAQ